MRHRAQGGIRVASFARNYLHNFVGWSGGFYGIKKE
jgi:hypothetical protein